MATTYERIRSALRTAGREESWASMRALSSDIRKRKLVAFRLRGDGSSIEDYMSEPSTRRMLILMRDFGLLQEHPDGDVSITGKGRKALESNESYALQIKSSVKTYLYKNGLPFADIVAMIKKIKLPAVPNASTIYENIPDPKPGISSSSLRKLLFLLSLAGGLNRSVRVHYSDK